MKIGDLVKLDPSNEALKFLSKRIIKDNYRGIQISQHNRYTYKQVSVMLKEMYKLVENKKMQIRTTDISKRKYNLPGEKTYAEFTNIINNKFGKGTQDSIRKNLFVDFSRMGLIERYDQNGCVTDNSSKKCIKYVSLTKLGLSMIDDNVVEINRSRIFTRAIDNLLQGLASDLLDIMMVLEKITISEMQYFITFLYQEFDNKILIKENIINLVQEYRKLPRAIRKEVDQITKNVCDPKLYSGNKKDKRDYHNWRNESEQIFTILNMSVFYEYDKQKNTLYFKIDKNNKNSLGLKRSTLQKKEYFDKHLVKKSAGFELHHIVPLSWSTSPEDFDILDKWENMIYIDGYTHSKITQNRNRNIILKINHETHNVIFEDWFGKQIFCKYLDQVKYNFSLENEMLDKNNNLLKMN